MFKKFSVSVMIIFGLIVPAVSCESVQAASILEVIAADNVMKETRTLRKSFGALGAVGGAAIGYSSAVAVGASLPMTAVITVGTATLCGIYLYGVAAAGMEYGVSSEAKKHRKMVSDAYSKQMHNIENFLNKQELSWK